MTIYKTFIFLIVNSLLIRQATGQEKLSAVPPSAVTTSARDNWDFEKTVLPIADLKFLGIGFEGMLGTGFCLDSECRFIGTNYHVAALAHPRRIKGQKVIGLYLATGPKDEDASINAGLSTSPMRYNLGRDLAIYELNHALPQYHGAAFSLDDLEIGRDVDIYAYPKEGISPVRSLLKFHGRFQGQTQNDLLAFSYSLSAGKSILGGASGGIVVDSKTDRIVGILSAVALANETVALAVPVQALADFVGKVQPTLARNLFPPVTGIAASAADIHPKLVPPHVDALQHRSQETAQVKLLRTKAQLLTDSMANFVAIQSFAWGSGNREPSALSAYEVQVLGGYQKFREYPDGKKELQEMPWPDLNRAVNTGGEWSQLPAMVGTELELTIHQADDATINGRRIMVFQYSAEPEDGVCRFKSISDFVFFAISKIASVGCYGEVWTDEDTNILRMSTHYELQGAWKAHLAVVTYGWLRRKNEPAKLIPVTISTQAEYKKKLYWCRGEFTGYKEFRSTVKILAEAAPRFITSDLGSTSVQKAN